jgi:hypothetical protein
MPLHLCLNVEDALTADHRARRRDRSGVGRRETGAGACDSRSEAHPPGARREAPGGVLRLRASMGDPDRIAHAVLAAAEAQVGCRPLTAARCMVTSRPPRSSPPRCAHPSGLQRSTAPRWRGCARCC